MEKYKSKEIEKKYIRKTEMWNKLVEYVKENENPDLKPRLEKDVNGKKRSTRKFNESATEMWETSELLAW